MAGRDARAFEIADANARERLTRVDATESHEPVRTVDEKGVAVDLIVAGEPVFRKVVKNETVEYDGDLLARKPGAYMFIRWRDGEEPCGIMLSCPCGCGARRPFFFAGCGKEPDQPGIRYSDAERRLGAPEWHTAPYVGAQYPETRVFGDWPVATFEASIEFPARADGHAAWRGKLVNGVFVED